MSASNADRFCDDLAAARALRRHDCRVPIVFRAASIKARHITSLITGLQDESGAVTGIRFPDGSIAVIRDGIWRVQDDV